MRYLAKPLSALFAIGLTSASASSLPEVGDTEKEILEKFGAPHSKLDTGSQQVLNFEGCSIRLQDGNVIAVAPSAPRQTPEQIQAKRLEIANRQYKKYSNSAHVIQLSPQARLDFWKQFQRKHPSIDVSHELKIAKNQWQNEISTKRLLELEKIEKQKTEYVTSPKSSKSRSYTRRYLFSNPRHNHHHKRTQPERKKGEIVRFAPERGLTAIAGVKPILSAEIEKLRSL